MVEPKTASKIEPKIDRRKFSSSLFKKGPSNPGGIRHKLVLPTRDDVLLRLWAVARRPRSPSQVVVAACKALLEELPSGRLDPGKSARTLLPSWLKDDGDDGDDGNDKDAAE